MANNRTMTGTQVLKIILESAKLYRDNLADKNLIIISYNANTKLYNYIETVFLERNFLHMTGVQIRPEKAGKPYNPDIGGAMKFYELCLLNELKLGDFKQAVDGTTPLKMNVLPQLMKLTGNLMGDFNFTKNRLVTEKLVGNQRGCMGFVKENNYYIPNTVIQDDIRDITYKTNSVVCILIKEKASDKYTHVKYMKKAKATKKKIKGIKVIIPPINHIDGICSLDIVNDKVDKTIFEQYNIDNVLV